MRIGILVTSMGNFGQKGFYNTQEIGLAKAMAPLVDQVIVYKLVAIGEEKRAEAIGGCGKASVVYIPAKGFGINGILDTSVLDKTLDVLIYFSDTQFSVPRVYKWAKNNGVRLLPYIGVTESHSTSPTKKLLVNGLFGRNLRVYKKSRCLVKTPTVEGSLRAMGVRDITVTPVGLDLGLLKADYAVDRDTLKEKHGFASGEKVALFIGRMIEEKQPLRMLDVFERLVQEDPAYRLLMVGTGELSDAVANAIKKKNLSEKVQRLERIPNSEIWELYRLSDAFVNLNRQEIFGMAILEAMYYGCKVVAWHAPGPNLIIENGVSGWLADSDAQIVRCILDETDMSEASHRRIVDHFTWQVTARRMVEAAGKD